VLHYSQIIWEGTMDKPSLELICEMPKFKIGLEAFVRGLGYEICSNAEIMVLVDARMGTALRYLELHGKTKPTLVITDNACPAYHQCLEVFKPEGFAFNSDGSDQIIKAVAALQNKQIFNNLPKSRIKFSPRDLKIARQLARGLENRQIAQVLNLSENSVKTYVKEILDKARFASVNHEILNRTQFALWFWGQDHVLDAL
jgi:DNA-binding NarL/FixJ family response regulator